MSRVKASLGVILGTLLLIAGYLIPRPRWIQVTSIPLASELSPELLALSISVVFFFAVIGGYAILASAANKTMMRAAIISSAALVGSLTTAMLASEMSSRSFEVAKAITLSAGALLGGFLRVPQHLRPLEPPEGGFLSGTDLHAYMEKRIESSHSYRRNIIDNLIRWYTVFIGVNYVSMGWFATGGETQEDFVALIAAMFITQNVLGIMACLRIKRYLLESSYQIARYEQVLVGTSPDEERETREAFIPSRVYGRAIQLMVAGLVFIVLVWVALSLAKERRSDKNAMHPERSLRMLREPGGVFRLMLLAALILAVPGSASAVSDPQASEPEPEGVTIEIGSTYSFGQTPAGVSVTRSFRLVNKDTERPMRIYGFWISQDMRHPEWAIVGKPGEEDWLPAGETTELKLLYIAASPGEHKADVSWYVEMKPMTEVDEDNFFVFSVTGEAIESEP